MDNWEPLVFPGLTPPGYFLSPYRLEAKMCIRTSNKTGLTGREILAQGFGRRPMPWGREERIINAA